MDHNIFGDYGKDEKTQTIEKIDVPILKAPDNIRWVLANQLLMEGWDILYFNKKDFRKAVELNEKEIEKYCAKQIRVASIQKNKVRKFMGMKYRKINFREEGRILLEGNGASLKSKWIVEDYSDSRSTYQLKDTLHFVADQYKIKLDIIKKAPKNLKYNRRFDMFGLGMEITITDDFQ